MKPFQKRPVAVKTLTSESEEVSKIQVKRTVGKVHKNQEKIECTTQLLGVARFYMVSIFGDFPFVWIVDHGRRKLDALGLGHGASCGRGLRRRSTSLLGRSGLDQPLGLRLEAQTRSRPRESAQNLRLCKSKLCCKHG